MCMDLYALKHFNLSRETETEFSITTKVLHAIPKLHLQ